MMRSFPTVPTLAVLCAGLAGLLAVGATSANPDGRVEAAAAAAPASPRGPLPGFRAPPVERSAVIVERPLFSPSRRPPEPEPVVAAPEPPVELPDVVLIGTIVTKSDRRAILRAAGEAAALVMAEGQEVEGWTIAGIEPDRMLLRRGGTEESIRLEDPATVEPPKPAPARPAQLAQRPGTKTTPTEKPASRSGNQSRSSFYSPR